MKNWQIIFWLVIFFPLGLYLMFRYSDWQKPVKYGTIAIFIFVLFLGGAENWAYILAIGAFFASIVGLFSVFRKKSRSKGAIALALGIVVLIASGLQINEYQVQEQLAIEAAAEAERVAEEERLAEIAKAKEEKRLEQEKREREEQRKLRNEAIELIEAVEDKPTQVAYDRALKVLNSLDKKDTVLLTRLDEVLPEVEAYEELVSIAEKAVIEAEERKDRDAYNQAYELVGALPIPRRTLERQLEKVDNELVKIEKEQQRAAEKAAEEERVAAEKAAEEQRQATAVAASQQASSGSSNNSSTSTAAVAPPVQTPEVTPSTVTVYIAPESGTKYHYSQGCRGLNNANSIQGMSLNEAEGLGYELCGWEK